MKDLIQQLQQQFGCESDQFYCDFKQQDELIICEVKTNQCSASIAIQGAHILTWQPTGENDVIWLSKDARFKKGKSIRGGIPICWPWFGAHDSQAQFPAHGFARTVDWQLLDVRVTEKKVIKLHFQLDTQTLSPSIQLLWPNATLVDYYLEFGKQFNAKLVTKNLSPKKMMIGQALHSYFAVDDVRQVEVTGLDTCQYLDKPQQFLKCTQQGDIHFKGEVDRVYIDTSAAVEIIDHKRTINISKQGSQSTIVWNPGEKVANKMGDLGEQGYLKMLCVESANAANDTVTLAVGESTVISVYYQIQG